MADRGWLPYRSDGKHGVYWKPVYHVLAATMEVWVVNARDVKHRRGKKTDPADAKWIAELLAYGLIEPSFIPPPEIAALRDVIRMRTALVQTRKSEVPPSIWGTSGHSNSAPGCI